MKLLTNLRIHAIISLLLGFSYFVLNANQLAQSGMAHGIGAAIGSGFAAWIFAAPLAYLLHIVSLLFKRYPGFDYFFIRIFLPLQFLVILSGIYRIIKVI